jgi:hypothetical protein
MWLSIPHGYFTKYHKFSMCTICGYDVSLKTFLLLFTTYIFCMGVIPQTFVICPHNIYHFMVIDQLKKSMQYSDYYDYYSIYI